MPHLEKWALVSRPQGYEAPENNIRLNGIVTGHPRFTDGECITTTRIIKVEGFRVHTKSGSIYTIGQPHQDYEVQFPNARTRFLKGEL